MTGDIFVGSPYDWDKAHAFLGTKGKACTEARDYDHMIRIVQDREPRDKSLKGLGSEQWRANAEFPWELTILAQKEATCNSKWGNTSKAKGPQHFLPRRNKCFPILLHLHLHSYRTCNHFKDNGHCKWTKYSHFHKVSLLLLEIVRLW